MIVKQGTNRYFCFTRKADFILEIVMFLKNLCKEILLFG